MPWSPAVEIDVTRDLREVVGQLTSKERKQPFWAPSPSHSRFAPLPGGKNQVKFMIGFDFSNKVLIGLTPVNSTHQPNTAPAVYKPHALTIKNRKDELLQVEKVGSKSVLLCVGEYFYRK